MVKIIRNTTGSSIEVKTAGIALQPSVDYTIPQQDYLLWASNDVISEISTYINNKQIVVKDGSVVLFPLAGLTYLQTADVEVTIFLSRGFGSDHIHSVHLTSSEINSLMMEKVSSIIKTSSGQDDGGAFSDHTHTVTVTWNATTGQLIGSVSTDNFHTHPFIPGIQPDPLSGSDIKRCTDVVLEETVPGFIRLKHDWYIANGTNILVLDQSEILLI